LLDKEAIVKVADIVRSDDFYRSDHGQIFRAILQLYENRSPIDLVTLTDQLEKEKLIDEVGGASYLASLASGVPSAAHVVQYAKIIQSRSTLRRLIAAGQEIVELGFREDKKIDEVLDKSERRLFDVSQKFLRQEFTPVRDVLTDSFDRIDQLHKHKGKLRGVPTGFSGLDNLLAGLQASDFIVLAGRPSMGKTSLGLNIVTHVAIREKLPVGIFSLEMSKEQLVDRLICSEAGLDSWKLRTGNLSDEDFPKIGYAMGVLSEAPLYIDDSPIMNVMEIRTKARRLQAEHGLSLVMVDYLQLMEGRIFTSEQNRVQEISEISRSLKALARELKIPVLALSQLSRAVEIRPSHIPQLADLRESGSIEQDADVVIFIYREEYYDKDTDRKNIADILIRKHRNGPTGDIELYFVPEQLCFKNLEKRMGEKVKK
jgi:replicative DNA helicase